LTFYGVMRKERNTTPLTGRRRYGKERFTGREGGGRLYNSKNRRVAHRRNFRDLDGDLVKTRNGTKKKGTRKPSRKGARIEGD